MTTDFDQPRRIGIANVVTEDGQIVRVVAYIDTDGNIITVDRQGRIERHVSAHQYPAKVDSNVSGRKELSAPCLFRRRGRAKPPRWKHDKEG